MKKNIGLGLLLMVLNVFSASASLRDTVLYLPQGKEKVQITLRYPEAAKPKGALLLLHGWNLPPSEWCEKTTFCTRALQEGFVLIIPDLGKTTYHFQRYPETKAHYMPYPTRRWIMDTAIVHLQRNLKLLLPGQNNFVAGISTGGRGAALLALELPKVFRAAACLSADFDQSKLTDDPIYNGYYGPYRRFAERWNGRDNMHKRAAEFKVPLFLAHGGKDDICPVSQTRDFYKEILRINTVRTELYIDEKAGHTYEFWESCSEPVLKFFLSSCR